MWTNVNLVSLSLFALCVSEHFSPFLEVIVVEWQAIVHLQAQEAASAERKGVEQDNGAAADASAPTSPGEAEEGSATTSRVWLAIWTEWLRMRSISIIKSIT